MQKENVVHIMDRIVVANKQNSIMLVSCFKTFYGKKKQCLEYKWGFKCKKVAKFIPALIKCCINVQLWKLSI
jgi:hypothetical protein